MSYPVCPKCGHAPLPADQSLPAACPACGIVLAKFATAPARAEHAELPDDVVKRPSLAGWLFHVPDEISKANWYGRGALLVAVIVYTFIFFRETNVRYGDLGGHLLWLLITPWHEAGHLIFSPFGQFMHIAGGTIMQHMFPIVLGFALLVKGRNPFGAAICFWLLGYSVIYTGWYMHDAGDPQGMMLSGKSSAEDDGHDFANLFGYFGRWWFDHAIGAGIFVARVGQAMMVAGLAWGAYMLWLQRSNFSDSPFAESPADRE
jgi:hypothetical protein